MFKYKEVSKQRIVSKEHGLIWKTLLVLVALLLPSIIGWKPLHSIGSLPPFFKVLITILGFLALALTAWLAILTSKTKEIAKRNGVVDAFTKSVEQLGSYSRHNPNIEVRLSAIYTLEKLSQNNRELYQTIIEILANYVRENAAMPPYCEKTPSDSTRIDVQTAMTVLGRRKVKYGEPALNLHRTYLPEINLKHANLQNADLMGADLRGANLSQAKLQGACLFSANLTDANLVCASLNGTDVTAAKGLDNAQLKLARNWRLAFRDQELACGAGIPEFLEKYSASADYRASVDIA